VEPNKTEKSDNRRNAKPIGRGMNFVIRFLEHLDLLEKDELYCPLPIDDV